MCGAHEISIFQTTSTKSPLSTAAHRLTSVTFNGKELVRYDYDGYVDLTAVYGLDGKKTVRFRLPQPRHGRLQAQARQRVQDLQESLKKRLSKSISVGGCSSTNSPKRLD